MLKHVEDVEDRSNTPKGCNAMYVEDVEDGKRTYTHILAHNFLNTGLMDFQSEKSFGKLRLRAFQPYHQILCMLKHVEDRSNTHKGCNAMYVEDVKDIKTSHTHTFWLITSLILNGFSIRKKFWKAETESFPKLFSDCIFKYVEDVEDRSNTHKGCNVMYVEDVKDIKTSHNRCILKYVEDVKDRSNTHKGCNAMYVEDVEDGKRTYTHILAHNFLNT